MNDEKMLKTWAVERAINLVERSIVQREELLWYALELYSFVAVNTDDTINCPECGCTMALPKLD